MCTQGGDQELRATWRQLRMVGDFDVSMRNPAVRRAVEAAARAIRDRKDVGPRRCFDSKLRAANDTDN